MQTQQVSKYFTFLEVIRLKNNSALITRVGRSFYVGTEFLDTGLPDI